MGNLSEVASVPSRLTPRAHRRLTILKAKKNLKSISDAIEFALDKARL